MAKPAQITMYVIDASVAIKWFSEEEYTDKAIEIRNKFFKGEYELAVPDLILYEVTNALRFNPNFNEEDVIEAVNSLFDMGVSIIVPTPRVVKSSITMAFKYNITIQVVPILVPSSHTPNRFSKSCWSYQPDIG